MLHSNYNVVKTAHMPKHCWWSLWRCKTSHMLHTRIKRSPRNKSHLRRLRIHIRIRVEKGYPCTSLPPRLLKASEYFTTWRADVAVDAHRTGLQSQFRMMKTRFLSKDESHHRCVLPCHVCHQHCLMSQQKPRPREVDPGALDCRACCPELHGFVLKRLQGVLHVISIFGTRHDEDADA